MAVQNIPYYTPRLPFQQGRAVVLPTMKSDLDGLSEAIQWAMEHRMDRKEQADRFRNTGQARNESATLLADTLQNSESNRDLRGAQTAGARDDLLTSAQARTESATSLADALENSESSRNLRSAQTAGYEDDLLTTAQNRTDSREAHKDELKNSKSRRGLQKAQKKETRQAARALKRGKPLTMEEIRHNKALADGKKFGTPEYWEYVKAPGSGQTINLNMPGDPPSAGERKAMSDTQASIDRMNNLEHLWGKAVSGPIVGPFWKVMGFFNWAPQEQEDFMAATNAITNQIIKDITGAAMSVEEAERIMGQIPQISDAQKRWRSKWDQTKLNMVYLQQRRKQVLEESGMTAPPMGETSAPMFPGRPGQFGPGSAAPPGVAPVLQPPAMQILSDADFEALPPAQQDAYLKLIGAE